MTNNNNQQKTISISNDNNRPFDRAIINHVCLDVMVSLPIKNPITGRPWLTILLDDYSKRVLGFYLSLNPPSYVSNMMVIRECVKKHSKLPKSIEIEGLNEFHSEQFENMMKELYCDLIYKDNVCYLLSCERLLRTVYDFLKNENHEESLWSLGNFKNVLSLLLYEVYDLKYHLVLGNSPREIFETAVQKLGDTYQRIHYEDKFKMLTYPIIERRVIPGRGIKINDIYYWTDEFIKPELNMQKIKVNYDPLDINVANAYINDIWKKLVRNSGLEQKKRRIKRRSINIYDPRF